MEDRDELVHRARGGDAAAFDALIRMHYAECLRYATRMLGDRAEAEDVVQDSFVRAYRSLRRYEERDRFHAWLLRIVRNRCRSVAARRAWRLRELRQHLDATPIRAASNDADLTSYDLDRALARLPVKQREAFLLKHVEQLRYDEIVRITGVSEAALKMRVKRACDALRDLLGED